MAEPIGNRSFNFSRCDNYIKPKASDRAPVGYFDAVDCKGGSGWATDPDSEGQTVTVRFFDGPAQDNWTNLLGEVKANVVRGAPVGAHGFVWTIPDKIRDGQSHRIYAYAYSNETPTVFLQLPQSSANQSPPPALSCSPIVPQIGSAVSSSSGAEGSTIITTGTGGGTQTTTSKPGDTNGDGKVDIYDYSAVVRDFGKKGSGISGDVDRDGDVDIFDYSAVVANFNK
jgi:hypothetical protein